MPTPVISLLVVNHQPELDCHLQVPEEARLRLHCPPGGVRHAAPALAFLGAEVLLKPEDRQRLHTVCVGA